MLKRKVSPTKRPSMPKVGLKPSTLSQRNGFSASRGDAEMPKTRFTLNDRSISSPRLKSFPAEKIKRLESSPPRNFSESAEIPHPTLNNGQGDTLQQPPLQFIPSFQHATLPNPNISSISERQVPRSLYPVSNQVNQSELAIPTAMENASMGRPSHRPFVPNVPQTNLTMRDHSPRKKASPRLFGPSQTIHQSQLPRTIEPEAHVHHRDPCNIENDAPKTLDPEKGSAEDRHVAFHRRDVETRGNQSTGMREPIHPTISPIPGQNLSNLGPAANSTGWQDSRQIYRAYQPNMLRYCNDNDRMEMTKGRITEGHPGMTSPQDIAVNQIQNYQRMLQHGPYGWTTHPQNSWIRNERAMIQPYAMDIVASGINAPPNSHVRCQYPQHGMQVPNYHQHPAGNCPQQQQQQHQQQYCHSAQVLSTPPVESTNATKHPENPRRGEDTKGNALRFTQTMIRDQEMLVETMRQQGIPEDIMRRQFDGLLAEQRKQLLYLEQLKRGDTTGSDKLQQRRRVQRKISRIEEDGKPEWMLHITPPRIPYSTIEKMRYEKEVNSQQTATSNGNALQADGVNGPQEIYDRTDPSNYQRTRQTNGYENWQLQAPHASYVCYNSNVPNQHRGCNVNSGISGDQSQQSMFYGFPDQYPQQRQPYMRQIQEKLQIQGPDSNDREEFQQTQRQRYEEPERKIEPSSLLKLRLYKEVVRKQKQNNGLQDPETVKEAMEAQKNPANRRGLEYLEHLNKRREKPVSLNGAQDPQKNIPLPNGPQQQYISLNCQQNKMPSANGLENHRNLNNPQPPSNLLRRKLENPHFAEYPRQRTRNVSRDCCSLMAERENGTVADSSTKKYQQQHSAEIQNPIGGFQHMQSKSENNLQFPTQMQRDSVYADQIVMANCSPSMPLAFNEKERPEFHTAPIEQYYENRDKRDKVNGVNPQLNMIGSTRFGDRVAVDGNNANLQQQQQHYHCPYKNNELHEVITIGGIKYLARKPEYIQNSTPGNPGKCFNPMISCQ